MRRFILALILALVPLQAFGQCSGLFPAQTLCGNFTGASAPPGPASIASAGIVFGPGASTAGHFATWNNASGTLLADYNLFGGTNTWSGTNNFNGAANLTATGGSTARSLQDIAANVVFAKDYGALCDSSTDDTTALQAAITATPDGGTLKLPNGFCKVLGSGNAALTITRAISIEGQGIGSGILPDAAFPNTRDFILVAPTVSSRGFSFRGFYIAAAGLGRHAIKVDGGAGSLTFNMYFDRMTIAATNAGSSIYGTGNAAGGGVIAYSTISNSNLESILMDTAGDGLSIINNVIGATGTNTAINVTQVVGAGGLYIAGNVIVGAAGMINVERGYPVIEGNELEQASNNTQAHGAMIDLNGGTGTGVASAQIMNNTLSVLVGITGVTNAIRVGTAADTSINGNRIGVRGATTHITVTSGAVDTVIGASNAYYTNDTKVGLSLSDSGFRTGMAIADYFLTLAANQTGSDVNTAQTWFPGGGATLIQVMENSTYEFEGTLATARTVGGNNHTTSNLFGGTATVSSIAYTLSGIQTTGGSFSVGNQQIAFPQVATASSIFSATASANENIVMKVKGLVRFTTGGTFIPQFKYDNAPGGAPTVQANSYFKMRLLGSNTVLSRGWN